MRKPGFTLIEVLVALTIFSLIALGLYSAFRTGVMSSQRMDEMFEQAQSVRALATRMEIDLTNAFAYLSDDTRFKGNGRDLECIAAVPRFNAGGSVTFEVCRISYAVNPGGLVRRFSQGPEAFTPAPDAEETVQTYRSVEVNFRYACPTTDPQAPYEWIDAWPKEGDPLTQARLPLAIRIEFRFPGQKIQTKTIVLPYGSRCVGSS